MQKIVQVHKNFPTFKYNILPTKKFQIISLSFDNLIFKEINFGGLSYLLIFYKITVSSSAKNILCISEFIVRMACPVHTLLPLFSYDDQRESLGMWVSFF